MKKPRSWDGSAQKQLPGVVLRPEQDSFEMAEHTGALKIINRYEKRLKIKLRT